LFESLFILKYFLLAQITCAKPASNLIEIKVPYYNFSGDTAYGTLVINKAIEIKTKAVFNELLKLQFPIEKMQPISFYNNNDTVSMMSNNTSCYCYRTQTKSKKLSKHALGLAIDINPMQNPYIKNNIVLPKNYMANAAKGIVRYNNHLGKKVIAIFEKYGFSWGGYWRNKKDYMHFEYGGGEL
jgi:hypothetical protein